VSNYLVNRSEKQIRFGGLAVLSFEAIGAIGLRSVTMIGPRPNHVRAIHGM
jgi:hypothetical protein